MLSRFEFISSLPVKVRPFFALLLVKWILHYQWVLQNVSKLQIYNYQQVWRLTNGKGETALQTRPPIPCPHCQSGNVVKNGHYKNGTQRYKCKNPECPRTAFPVSYGTLDEVFGSEESDRRIQFPQKRFENNEPKEWLWANHWNIGYAAIK